MAEFVTKLAKQFHAAKAKLSNMHAKSEETMGEVKKTIEVGGAAFGWSYANARYGKDPKSGQPGSWDAEIDVFGVPADVGTFVALKGLALFGVFGKYDEDAGNLGDGSLAAFAARQGIRRGQAAQAKAPAHTAGALGQGNPWNPYGAYQPQTAARFG